MTNILGSVYWLDNRDNVGHFGKGGDIEKGGYVCM